MVFVLVHSPLVGPLAWLPVQRELEARGFRAVVPRLSSDPSSRLPYWKQHARSVQSIVEGISSEVILVAHSGAGVILPAIREALSQTVATYIFVDAILPQNGKSRLELFDTKEEAEAFRRAAHQGLLPTWTEEDLRDVIPSPRLRQKFVEELQPLPLAVYEEPIPVFDGWPDAPCGFIHFSPAYDSQAQQAQRNAWPYIHLSGGHFHMLTAPEAVCDSLLILWRQIGIQ